MCRCWLIGDVVTTVRILMIILIVVPGVLSRCCVLLV